jgi:xanthine/CO dehydrogenase XdhC/CoxF family maturation factor
MTDIERIQALWRELESAGADYVLTTVVGVEGPSYRKPGALMLITADGRRAGTVSGGCLEAEVASRAWWLTKDGPTVERYSTADDDGDRPYGSGCGGTVILLLERSATARVLLGALDRAFTARSSLAVATIVEGPQTGVRAIAGTASSSAEGERLSGLAELAFKAGKPMESLLDVDGAPTRVWCDFRPARTGLWVFGAGDDARPLVRLAKELGWFVVLADGRSHLATRERFPLADDTRVLAMNESARQPANLLGPIQPHDVAVVMSHSFEQDSRVLAALLAGGVAVSYLGVLGPQRRTQELLAEAAALAGYTQELIPEQAEEWLTRLHAPTGLDLGAESPETVALSIVAEIQKVLAGATALPLREVRAVQAPQEADPIAASAASSAL